MVEEAGLETDGMAETTSQLQAKLKALTDGKVDIMVDSDSFKNTTEILREMSAEWEHMTDVEQAAALELLGGKRQANILAAIINNFDIVEDAIGKSQNSAGSALEENEKVLDSIQGRINLFNNALETMWNNTLDDGLIKWFVNLGTELIKIIDDLGLLKVALVGFSTRSLTKILNIDWNKPLSSFKQLFGKEATISVDTMRQNLEKLEATYNDAKNAWKANPTIDTRKAVVDAKKNFDEYNQMFQSVTELDNQWAKAQENLTRAQASLNSYTGNNAKELYKLEDGVKRAKQRIVELEEAQRQTRSTGSSTWKILGNGVKAFGKQISSVLTQMLVMWAISKVISLIGDAWDAATETFEESKQSFEDLRSELSNTESELQNLENQLSTINDQIKDLQNNGLLTFTEQEELDRLKAQSAELERQRDLQRSLKEQQQIDVTNSAVNASEKYRKTGTESGKTTGERVISGALTGGVIGAAATSVAGGALATAIGSAIGMAAGPLGTIIGGLIGTAIGAALGAGAGAIASASEGEVGETLDNMTTEYARLQKELDDARATYQSKGDTDNREKFEEAQENLKTYESNMAQYISQLQEYANSIDPTVSDAAKREKEEIEDTIDKWLIQSDSKDAKTNAIERIFSSDNLKGVKKQMEDIAKTGGEIHLTDYFNTADLDAFNNRLLEMGIYTHEVEEYFQQIATSTSGLSDLGFYGASKDVGGIAGGIESITSALETAKTEGYLTAEALIGIEETVGGVEKLGDVWTRYAETMSSVLASTKAQKEATEELVRAFIDQNLAIGSLTSSQRAIYVAQFEEMGIWNADEYIDDKVMENMFRDIQQSAKYSEAELGKAWRSRDNKEIKIELGVDGKSLDEVTTEVQEQFAQKLGLAKVVTSEGIQEILDEYDEELPELRLKLDPDTPQEIKDELNQLGEGGAVDLTVRPNVDTKLLSDANWDDVGDGHATVFTNTAATADKTIAMNFTPILPDGTVMEKDKFERYIESVVNGGDDYLNLKIGATFTGESAIADAEAAAKRIHEIHEGYLTEDATEEHIIGLYNKRNELEVKHRNILKKEVDIKSYDEQISKLEDIKKAYGDLGKVEEALSTGVPLHWGRLLNGELTPEDYYDNIVSSMGLDYSKEDFIKDWNAWKPAYEQLQVELNTKDVSYSDIDKKINELNNKKITLETELETAPTEERRDAIEQQIAEIEAEIEGFTPEVKLKFMPDMESIKTAINNVQTAINESASSSGLTGETVKNVENAFSNLEGIDTSKLFERNANGIRVNVEELERLSAAQEKLQKDEYENKLIDLKSKYEELSAEIAGTINPTKKLELLNKQSSIARQIENISILAAEYDGLTSAYQEWINAQSTANAGDIYADVQSKIETLEELYKNGDIGTDDFRKGVQFISDQDLTGATPEQLVAAYKTSMPNIKRYFTEGSEGVVRFLEDVQSVNSEWASMDKATGKWSINIDDLSAVGEELHISEEAITAIFGELQDKGFKINFDSVFDNLATSEDKLNEMVATINQKHELNLDIDFEATDSDYIQEKIDEIYANFGKEDGTLELSIEGAEEVQTVLAGLLMKKSELNQPAVMKVDTTNATSNAEKAVSLLQQYWEKYNELDIAVKVGASVEERQGLAEELREIVGSLQTQDGDTMEALGIKIPVGVDPTTISEQELLNIQTQINGLEAKIMVEAGVDPKLVDEYVVDEKEGIGTVKWKNDTNLVDKYIQKEKKTKGTVEWTNIETNSKPTGDASARGTAFASGNAFARGNWGASRDGSTLGGELGPEIVVFMMPPYIVIYKKNFT